MPSQSLQTVYQMLCRVYTISLGLEVCISAFLFFLTVRVCEGSSCNVPRVPFSDYTYILYFITFYIGDD